MNEAYRSAYTCTSSLPTAGPRFWRYPNPTLAVIGSSEFGNRFADVVSQLRYTPFTGEECVRWTDGLIVSASRGVYSDTVLLGSTGEDAVVEAVSQFKAAGKPVVTIDFATANASIAGSKAVFASDLVYTTSPEAFARAQGTTELPENVGTIVPTFSPFLYNPIGRALPLRPDILLTDEIALLESREKQNAGMLLKWLAEAGYLITRARTDSILPRSEGPEAWYEGTVSRDLLTVDQVASLRKHYAVALTFSSDAASQFNFNSSVVEALASGNVVLSNYHDAINSRLPTVRLFSTEVDLQTSMPSILGHSASDASRAGVRDAFSAYCSTDQIDRILHEAGLGYRPAPMRIAIVSDDQNTSAAVLSNQALPHFAEVFSCGIEELALNRAGFDVVVPVSREHTYSGTHLLDIATAFKYANVDFVVHSTAGSWDKESEYVTEAETDAVGIAVDSTSFVDYLETGKVRGPGLSVRGSIEAHRDVIELRSPSRPELSVIVPVYNNGRHLESKALPSLRRSSLYHRMEIILVDDGSSDAYTKEVIAKFAAQHRYAKVFAYPEGGSGSASRPRNKGLELVSTPWTGYLDPDNEVIDDGLRILFDVAEREGSDLTVGNTIRYDGRPHKIDYYETLRLAIAEGEQSRPGFGPTVLKRVNFSAISPQVLLANTAWLRSLGLEQVVGAVGQDTFFSQQMLYYSDSISIVDSAIGIYYSAVANSTVNHVTARFFEKYLPLELVRADWLKQVGLMADYQATRLEGLFAAWYLPKLRRVSDEDFEKSLSALRQIAALYPGMAWRGEDIRKLVTSEQPFSKSDFMKLAF